MCLFEKNVMKLDKLEAAKILENIFEECETEPNSVPIEELESYSNYRKESFRLQMGILIGALICFIFLPLFFVAPNYEVRLDMNGERGLPEYTVDISTMLPVKSVTAKMNGYKLPVYAVDGHTFTIEPTSNGKIELIVELFSGQWKSKKLSILNVDSEKPNLVKMQLDEDESIIYVEDTGSGIDYESIYAVTEDGEEIRPVEYDREAGSLTFSLNLRGKELYISDNFKNVLHLKL